MAQASRLYRRNCRTLSYCQLWGRTQQPPCRCGEGSQRLPTQGNLYRTGWWAQFSQFGCATLLHWARSEADFHNALRISPVKRARLAAQQATTAAMVAAWLSANFARRRQRPPQPPWLRRAMARAPCSGPTWSTMAGRRHWGYSKRLTCCHAHALPDSRAHC